MLVGAPESHIPGSAGREPQALLFSFLQSTPPPPPHPIPALLLRCPLIASQMSPLAVKANSPSSASGPYTAMPLCPSLLFPQGAHHFLFLGAGKAQCVPGVLSVCAPCWSCLARSFLEAAVLGHDPSPQTVFGPCLLQAVSCLSGGTVSFTEHFSQSGLLCCFVR